jgi:cleavage and polyadenylation specificity factor subunit 3
MMESRDELVLGDERVSEGVAAGEEEMTIMPLGGGQEVGRSCILLKYRGRTVMLDCGNHPGREGE